MGTDDRGDGGMQVRASANDGLWVLKSAIPSVVMIGTVLSNRMGICIAYVEAIVPPVPPPHCPV